MVSDALVQNGLQTVSTSRPYNYTSVISCESDGQSTRPDRYATMRTTMMHVCAILIYFNLTSLNWLTTVNSGSCNRLVPSSNKPLPEPLYSVTIGDNESKNIERVITVPRSNSDTLTDPSLNKWSLNYRRHFKINITGKKHSIFWFKLTWFFPYPYKGHYVSICSGNGLGPTGAITWPNVHPGIFMSYGVTRAQRVKYDYRQVSNISRTLVGN